ncbi:hypothetical protein D030_5091B, partial [Vibrio parahaemolyticus AQ3810]
RCYLQEHRRSLGFALRVGR